jgi:hypothetical protein
MGMPFAGTRPLVGGSNPWDDAQAGRRIYLAVFIRLNFTLLPSACRVAM